MDGPNVCPLPGEGHVTAGDNAGIATIVAATTSPRQPPEEVEAAAPTTSGSAIARNDIVLPGPTTSPKTATISPETPIGLDVRSPASSPRSLNLAGTSDVCCCAHLYRISS